jgi:glycosyltransferase involved in cell wall biosynthesis
MHIVLVHTDLRVYWPARLLALGKALRRQNMELSVVEIAGSGSPYDFAGRANTNGDLDWHILFPDRDLRQMAPRVMAQAVERKLDGLHPEIVMAGSMAYPSGAAAVRWTRRNRRAVVLFDDVRLVDVPRPRVVEFVKRHVYANVDAILIPAESHARSYATWGVPETRMFFGVDVVDNEWFANQVWTFRKTLGECRAEEELPSPFFLGVGRHVAKKNWLMCLSAYADYRRVSRRPPWGLILVGDGPEQARLRQEIDRRRIPDVHLAGAVYGADLIHYYAAAGALVLPSRHGETWGLVVNEAMACGLPVLVSRQCGCAETLVQNGVNGWTFSPDDPNELALRMLQISSLTDHEYQTMARASQEIIHLWDLERFVQGAEAAITACQQVNRGFTSLFDRLLITLWNGRYRPT